MLGCVSTFKRPDHTIIKGELRGWLQRETKSSRRDFDLIRYNRLGVFCIVEFLSPNRDVFVDTMNLGKSLGTFDREKAQELLRRIFKPVTCDQTSRILSETDSDYHHMRQDWNDEELESEARAKYGE